jgi:hypothetical protein
VEVRGDLLEDHAETTELIEAGAISLAFVFWGNVSALVVHHGGDEALHVVTSAALVVAALSKGWGSNNDDVGLSDFSVVGLLTADCSGAFVAAEAAATSVNAVSSLLAVGDGLRHSINALTPMPLVAAPEIAVARGSVNRLIAMSNFSGSRKRSLDGNRRCYLVFGNEILQAVEVRAAIMNAVSPLLAVCNDLGNPVYALASMPTITAPDKPLAEP